MHIEGGVDIGIVNQAGIITRSKKYPEKLFPRIRSAAQHHNETGYRRRLIQQRQITKDIDVQVKRTAEKTFDNLRRDFWNGNLRDTDLDLVRDDEKFVDAKFRAYSSRKLLSFKLTKHIRTIGAIDRFVSSLVPVFLNLIIYYGDGWNGQTSFRG